MDADRLDRWMTNSHGKKPPYFRSLPRDEVLDVSKSVWNNFGFVDAVVFDRCTLVRSIFSSSKSYGFFPESSIGDAVSKIIGESSSCFGEKVFLSWDSFETMYEYLTTDFLCNVELLWFPSADDLDVVSESYSSTLLLSHYGEIRCWSYF